MASFNRRCGIALCACQGSGGPSCLRQHGAFSEVPGCVPGCGQPGRDRFRPKGVRRTCGSSPRPCFGRLRGMPFRGAMTIFLLNTKRGSEVERVDGYPPFHFGNCPPRANGLPPRPTYQLILTIPRCRTGAGRRTPPLLSATIAICHDCYLPPLPSAASRGAE